MTLWIVTRLSWALVVALGGCGAANREAAVGSPSAGVKATGTPTLAFTQVTLERKPCYGTCPVYSVSIAGDGAIVFDGKQHVDSARRVTGRLDAAGIAALAKLFEDNQYVTLDDKYVYGQTNCKPYASDAQVVLTSITTKDGVKKVEHDAGCASVPARLGDLERKIDQIVGTSRWIGKR